VELPKKQKTFWESLDKDTRDIIAIFAILVGVLFLVFVIQNPIVGGLMILSLLIAGGTFYWKFKTGNWWFQRNQTTTSSQPDNQPLIDTGHLQNQSPPKTQPGGTSSPSPYQRPNQPETPPPATLEYSPHVQSIIAKIRQFRPQRRVWEEKQYQDMLFAFMGDTFRSLKREVPFPNKKYIDAMIGDVGIELKFSPNESDFDRLYSQVESYLDNMPTVVVVTSRPKSPDALTYFEDKFRRRGWLNSRVFIVEQAV